MVSTFSLDQLSTILMARQTPPVGIFVSTALWDRIVTRFRQEARDPLAPIPPTFQGVLIDVDPSLPPAEFDVAFTRDAWSKRLAELKGAR